MRFATRSVVWTTLLVAATAVPGLAFAQGNESSAWGIALGAGLAIGLAGIGCGIGQGLATSSAVPRRTAE